MASIDAQALCASFVHAYSPTCGVLFMFYMGPSHHKQEEVHMRVPTTKTQQLFVGVTLLAYQASPCLGPCLVQQEIVFILLFSLLDVRWWTFSI